MIAPSTCPLCFEVWPTSMLRLTLADARRRGLVAVARVAPAPKARLQNGDPQRLLFDALRARLPKEPIVWEASGLVPGRRFRVDIWIPRTRIAIEMDGFQFHRSQTALQKDRERQNLLTAQGILVLRSVARQAFQDLPGAIDQIAQIHASRTI